MFVRRNYNEGGRAKVYEGFERQQRKLLGEIFELNLQIEEAKCDIEYKERQLEMINEIQLALVQVRKE